MSLVRAVLLLFNIVVAITDGITVPGNSYTCIIGGGYSGLATARYLKERRLKFTVFERSKGIGGIWRYDPHVHVDEYGTPVTTSLYKNLRTNSPRQTMEYRGFPFPKQTKTYVSGSCFYKYIKSFVKHFDLMKNVKLCSYVKSVRRNKNGWVLSYQQTENKKKYTVICDFVVVATGQHNKPYSAKFPGLNNFKGKIIHSHDYKTPEPYKHRNVLIIGAGPSGLDIAVQLHKTANKLLHSHHFKYNEPKFSKRYVKKPDINEFVDNGAVFNDSTFAVVDDVILATGYRLEHPFLDESSGLFLTDRFVMPLYNDIVNIRHPSMMFVGIKKQTINKVMDAQAEYVSLLISGKFDLPTPEIMVKRWMKKNSQRKPIKVNLIIAEMKKYFKDLTQEAGVIPVPPVMVDVIFESFKNLKQDLFHYMNYEFKIMDSLRFDVQYYKHHITDTSRQICPIEDIDL